MKKILVIDNYDSFVYNLVHILHELGFKDHTRVVRNDKITLEEVDGYDKIILSPGPGLPADAGIMPDLIKTFSKNKSILGVCLGHQAIAEAFGAKLLNLQEVLHGLGSRIRVTDKTEALFAGLPEEFTIGHYHSWVALPASVNEPLRVTAVDQHGNIMALRHVTHDVCGLQFHPESVLTEHGIEIIRNWLRDK